MNGPKKIVDLTAKKIDCCTPIKKNKKKKNKGEKIKRMEKKLI